MSVAPHSRGFARLLSGMASAVVLAGCAGAPPTRADLDGRVVCDAERMASVEARAQRDGVGLRWVNCPRVMLRVQ